MVIGHIFGCYGDCATCTRGCLLFTSGFSSDNSDKSSFDVTSKHLDQNVLET